MSERVNHPSSKINAHPIYFTLLSFQKRKKKAYQKVLMVWRNSVLICKTVFMIYPLGIFQHITMENFPRLANGHSRLMFALSGMDVRPKARFS